MTTPTFTEKAKSILKNLGFQINENTITAPFRRGPEDINIPEDITEEVARIRGYEHIANTPAKTAIVNQSFNGMVETMRITEQTLVEKCRLTQVETYPRVSEKQVAPFRTVPRTSYGEGGRSEATGDLVNDEFETISEEGGLLELQNPVNPECPLLRDSFLYQFIQIATKNAKFYDEF
jgi:phenylalanyl-tRNA synthetase beta subunit